MRILSVCLFLFFILKTSIAQPTLVQTIKGTVTDSESKKVLQGVSVVINGTNKAAITNTEGYFEIRQVPIGRHTIIFSLIGYDVKTIQDVLLTSGKELEVNVFLTESINKLTELTVKSTKNKIKPINEFATASARQFSVEETKRYAASVFDPARMVQNFAGVSNNGDMQNEIVVRGNSPKGILWRLEGVEIPNPNHFGGLATTGGGISMLSSSTLGSSDFYTGAFPAEIGNATSGVFDLNFREGNKNKKEYSFMLGALGIEAAAEGPFKKGSKATYLINYRYSTLSLLKGFLDNLGGVLPDYQDLSFKFNFPTKKAGTFQLFGLHGANKSIKNPAKDSTKWNDDNPNFTLDARGETGVAGISHQYFFNNKSFIKTIFSASGTNYRSNYDTLNPSRNYESIPTGRANQEDRAYRLSILYNNKLNVMNTLRAGIIASHLSFKFADSYYDDIDKVWKSLFNTNGNTQYYQAYVQWKHKFNNKLTVQSGLHSSFFALNKTYSVEPRVAITYQTNNAQIFTLAAGIHARPEHISTYVFDGKAVGTSTGLQNKDLEMSKAFHLVAGYEKTFSNQWRFKAEGYYQHLFDIPVEQRKDSWFSMLNATSIYDLLDIGTLVNAGTGKNTGIDITIEKPFSNNYYVLLTGSLFSSTYDTYEGKTFNTRFNRGHQLNILGGKEWKTGKQKKNVFALNGKVLTGGGLRVLPIDLAASRAAGKVQFQKDQYFSEKGLLYFRVDLGVSYKINKRNSTHTIMLDVQNLTNHQNLFYDWYDNKSQSIKRVFQMGLFPVVNYRIEF